MGRSVEELERENERLRERLREIEKPWYVRRLVMPMASAAITLVIVRFYPERFELPHQLSDVLTHPVGEFCAEIVVSTLAIIIATWSLPVFLSALLVGCLTSLLLCLSAAGPKTIGAYGSLNFVIWGLILAVASSIIQMLTQLPEDENQDYDESIGPDPGGPTNGCALILFGSIECFLLACSFGLNLAIALHGLGLGFVSSLLAAAGILGFQLLGLYALLRFREIATPN